MADALVYGAGAVLIAWGAAHIFATSSVADSFGAISVDNRRILVMEWVAEGVTHVSIGGLAILLAALEDPADPASRLVYRTLAGVLIAFAVLTSFTGARTPVIWFKACPFVLTGAAALLLVGSSL